MKIPEQILEEITGKVAQYEKGFVDGWETCARTIDEASDFFLKREGDLRKENSELKAQLEIAKDALKEIEDKCYGDDSRAWSFANDVLDKLETTGK